MMDDRRPRRPRQPSTCWAALVLALAVSCTSFVSDLEEFDGLIGYDSVEARESAAFEVRNTTRRPPHPWFRIDPIVELIGYEREVVAVERPRETLREVMRRLSDKSTPDLRRIVDIVWRLMLIADDDKAALDRATALRELEIVGRRLPGARPWKLEPWDPRPRDLREQETELRAILDPLVDLWPGPEVVSRSEDTRTRYVGLLQDLGRVRLDVPSLLRARLRLLLEALIYEHEAVVQQAIAAVLVASCKAGIVATARRHSLDEAPLVRIGAIELLFAVGSNAEGERCLGQLARATAFRTRGLPNASEVVDEAADVRRQLIQQVWSRADELPRDDKGAVVASPLLAFVVASADQDPDAGLRLLARDAVATLAGRDRDPDGAWIAAWYRDLAERGRAKDR